MKNTFLNKIFFFIFLFAFGLTSQAQNGWTFSRVDKDGDGSVEIRVDAKDNEVHVLVKGSFDKLFYYYSSDKGKTFKKSDLGKIKHRTFEVGEISSLIDHDGKYHIAYFSYSNDIVHAIKTGSTTWSRDTLLKGYGFSDPWHRILMDVDQNNKLHAFFKDNRTYKYFYQDESKSWITKPVIFDQSSLHEFTFDIDVKGNAHVVCNTYNEHLYHFYTTNLGSTWKTEDVGAFNADSKIAMKTDSKCNVHIAVVQDQDKFRKHTTVEGCTYVYKNGNTYKSIVLEYLARDSSEINSTSTFYDHIPSIDIDKKDGIHIAYLPGENHDFEYPIGDTIVYAYKAANSSYFKFQGVPLKDEFYPGVQVRVMNNQIYYAYIGSMDGLTNSMGIELAFKPFKLEDEDSILVEKNIEIQGEVTITSDTIKIELWDNGEEDGDVLSLFLNKTEIESNLKLTNEHQFLNVTINEKGEYIISVEAISEGLYPPCTAVVIIDDGTNQTTLTITSDQNKTGAIKILKIN